MVTAFIAVTVIFFSSCAKDDDGFSPFIPQEEPDNDDIKPSVYTVDKSFKLEVQPVKLIDKVYTNYVTQDVDLHTELSSIYIFGDGDNAGDYYIAMCRLTEHNGSMNVSKYEEHNHEKSTYMEMLSPYIDKMGIQCRLLDHNGNEVKSGDAYFFQTPRPETTIGTTTYTTGVSLSFDLNLCFGKEPNDEGEYDWKGSIVPIFPSLIWNNEVTRNLPDQSVELNTDAATRRINWNFVTNNANTMNIAKLPQFVKSDNVIEFAWVWHVPKGKVNSKDYNTDIMKVEFMLNPMYAYHYQKLAETSINQINEDFDKGYQPTTTPESERKVTIDFPSFDRTPIGQFSFKNVTRNYVKNIFLTTVKPNGKTAKLELKKVLDTNEYFKQTLQEGNYKLCYSIVNGDTGNVLGDFEIDDIHITHNCQIDISTLDAKRRK